MVMFYLPPSRFNHYFEEDLNYHVPDCIQARVLLYCFEQKFIPQTIENSGTTSISVGAEVHMYPN
jgi:hypothetical protein